MDNPDLRVLGLTCQLIGVFFVAISMVFKKPRAIIGELFGVKAGDTVKQFRDMVFKKNQLALGLILIAAGYVIQIVGLMPAPPGAPTDGGFFANWSPALFFGFLLLAIIALTAVANLIGLVWARRTFNRLLTEFLRDNHELLEENIQVTKQLGELVGVESGRDSSIEEYLHNFRRKLRLIEETD
jgi:hypothetical protein